ncbi:hypothetical protein GF406_23625 [candidate division KSB1 bacterium]|nr:hypothetical protein [candidate division KSB1 bacterium]
MRIIHVLFVLLFLISSLVAQSLTLLGRAGDGYCIQVVASGDTVVFQNGAYMQIADFSDPDYPVILSQTVTEGAIKDIALYSHYVYVITSTGALFIYDISDTTQPVLLATPDLALWRLMIEDGYLYATASDRIVIYDLSSPDQPQLKSTLFPSKNVGNLALSGSVLCVSAWVDSVYFYDISDKTRPVLLHTLAAPGSINRISWVDDKGYILNDSGVTAYDMSDPARPHYLDRYEQSHKYYDIHIDQDTLYAVSFRASIHKLHLSGEGTLSFVDEINTTGHPREVAATDSFLFVADQEAGLQCVQIKPGMATRGRILTSGAAYHVIEKDGYLYSGCSSGTFNVYDLSDPGQPERIFAERLGRSDIYGMAVNQDMIYLASRSAGIQTIDISDPYAPQEVHHFDPPSRNIESIVRDGQALYAGDTKGMVYKLDITDPAQPSPVDSVDTERKVYTLAMADDHLYAAERDSFVHIIDASGGSLSLTGNLEIPKWIYDVLGHRGYLYVSTGRELWIFSLDTPESPAFVKKLNIDHTNQLRAVGSFLYCAQGSSGLKIADISDPENPQWITGFDTYGTARSLYVDDPHVYIADHDDGVYILQQDLTSTPVANAGAETRQPSRFSLIPPYPNPFNSTVTLGFTLPRSGRVHLSLVNSLGQTVRVLTDKHLAAGPHTLHWHGDSDNGTPLSSGLYFLKAVYGVEQKVQKLLYVR